MEKNVVFHPIISSIQKIALYETKNKYYLVGSNNTETRFRILIIDRTESRDLVVEDDKVEYTRDKIQNILAKIDADTRPRTSYSGFGIVGFIRFLEGYYIVLINKRRKVAVVGYHTIYKIQDTCLIYIPNDTVRILHQDEQRYVKMFQSIDLSSNFYFSYSYDLTHTLQHNLTPPRYVGIPDLSDTKCNLLDMTLFPRQPNPHPSNLNKNSIDFGIRTQPHRKFVWNNYLLQPVEDKLHPDWILHMTHGFIDQTNVSIYGRPVYVTLIARRSSRYAGTRFLKRGANFQGDVANEVETEQMVYDSGVSSLSQGHYTSFVQMRGSIPGHWSQDTSKIAPKPAISIDLNDPFAETAGQHFNELLKRYGSPIIILNLVKKREKKKHESFLSREIKNSVRYLNQFLPPQHSIQYNTFDMARLNHKKEANVMGRLALIANSAIAKSGIFQSFGTYYAQKPNTVLGQLHQEPGRLQTGIIRTNCVDCLDRTNTAQFAIGKCALGYQLCALGILDSPKLEFDTDCVRMLESLYEDHGDTLALQYGGSHLVHRVKTYRKTAPWTSQGNDIMQTCRRYFNNTFSDAEKQNAHNLFLGLFVPEDNRPAIWEYVNDYYLHHFPVLRPLEGPRPPLTQWWESNVLRCLPFAFNEVTKSCSEIIRLEGREIEMIDAYTDYHRPDLLTELSDVYAYKISNSIRDFMPNCTLHYSPFVVRVGHGRRREETARKGETVKNPCLTGQSSTGSTDSSSNSSEASYTSEDESNIYVNDSIISGSKDSGSVNVTFESLFLTMRQVYGTEPQMPKKPDLLLYKKYVLMGHKANGTLKNRNIVLKTSSPSNFLPDTSEQVTVPTASRGSKEVYRRYIETGRKGGFEPSITDINKYQKYVDNCINESWIY